MPRIRMDSMCRAKVQVFRRQGEEVLRDHLLRVGVEISADGGADIVQLGGVRPGLPRNIMCSLAWAMPGKPRGDMTYSQAIEFLYSLRLFGMKLGLDNTLRLAAAMGNPHHRLRFIHVAGTNGKGSTCAMLESIYRAAGWRVGLFTSPHLVSFAERIQVGRRSSAGKMSRD
jgi:hypothetical protein